jgi:hypothetical protein
MPARAQVRDAQRALAALELNDRHVADRLEDVLARRTDVLTDQDRLVAALQAAPGQGSPGPSSYATGAPVSDFQEAFGAPARLPLVLPAHRGWGKTSTALPRIGEDPEEGHGNEGKTRCD